MATWPVWPPASVPWATTMSTPASTTARGVGDLAAHVDDEDTVLVAELDGVGRYAEAGNEDARPFVDQHFDLGDHVAGHRRQEVDAKRLVGGLAHQAHLGDHLVLAHRLAPRQPKPPASETAATSRW